MDFSNKTYRDNLILSLPEKWLGGGEICVCVLNFLDDSLYYGYNTTIIQPQKILLERGVLFLSE